MDYKEYLDKARIKQLAELQARYNQVYAKERAEAASSLIAGHRQLRRGLQNVGLAGRKGNLISGREKTAALEARRRYREYNAGLSRATNAFTTAAGQRMARQAIDDENRVKRAEAYAKWGDEYAAAKAEAEKEYAANLEEAKQEHLQYAQEYQNSYNAYLAQQAQYQAWLQQQAAAQAAAQQSAQQELIDPRFQGNNMQQQKQDLMAARAEQQRLQTEIQRLQMQQMAQNGVDPRQNAAFNTQQGKVNYISALAAARQQAVENELRNNDIDPRFAQNSMMQQTKPQASAIAASRRQEAVQAQYEQNLNEWREKIQRAEGITKPKTRNEYDKWHEAQVARQQMIDYERRVAALKYPAISNLITLSDSEFAMRYDAAEKAYKHAVLDAQILRKDSSSSMDDLSSDANDIEAKATAEFVKWQNAAHARDDAMGAFYNESVNTNMKLVPHAPTWASEKDHDGKNYTAAMQNHWDATQYARSHDTDGSKYMPLVNEWSFINGRTALNYTQTHAVSNFVNNAASGGKKTQQYNAFVANCAAAFYNQPEGLTKNEREKMEAMLTLANLMTDEERARFNTILRQGGGKEADKYFEYLYASVLPQRFDSYVNNEMEFQTRDGIGKVFESVISIPVNLAQGVSGVIHTLSTGQEDPIAAKLAATKYNLAQGARDAVGQGISSSITNALMNAGTAEDFAQWAGSAGNFLYGAGMSMADSATVAAISAGIGSVFQGAGLAAETASKIGSAIGGSLLGASAFNSSYQEALDNGLDPQKARITAIGNGLNEMIFETLSIGTLLEVTGKETIKVGKSAFLNWLVNTAVQAGVEGSEEVFTDIGNKIWDNRINGIFSEEMQKIREYVASGMSFNEAKEKVRREFAEQLGLSFLGGAISGGFMGGGAQFVNMISNRQLEAYGKTLSQEHIDDLKKYEYKSEQAQEILNSGTITNTDAAMLDIIHTQELVEESINYVEQAVAEGKMPQEIADIYKKFAEHSVQTETNPDGITDEEAEKMLPYVDTIKNAEAIKQGLGKIVEQQTAARKEFDALSFEQKQQRLQNITNETTALRNAPSLRVGASESRLSGQSASQEFTTRAKTDTITLNNDGSVKTANGSVTFDFGANKTVDAMTDNQARAIRFAAAIANKTGVNIKVEQEFVGDDRNKNGEYDPTTNTIRVNLSGTNSAIYTMSHELTHYLQANNKQAFADLSKAIQKQLSRTDLVGSDLPSDYQDIIGDYLTGDNTLFEALCAYEKERYAKEKINLTQAQVEEEVIARCCESFLGNSSLIADMTQNHTKSARAVYRFLNEIRADINALRADASERMAERGYASDASPEQSMLEQFADIDKIVKLWENGLRKVAKKSQESKRTARENTVEQTNGNRYSLVDSVLAKRLDSEETVKVYRAMQVIDGKLYPPMAAKVKSEDGRTQLVEETKIGEWYQADERPDLIDPKTGKWKLNKGVGTPLDVAYNPYFHTSLSPLNDQFSSAYKRNNLVVVEGYVPKSELTSGYKAQYAKDSVGAMRWHSGTVSAKLKTPRTVILSRYFKASRIMSDAEVASVIKTMLKDEDPNISIPQKLVTPGLYKALNDAGVKTTPMDGTIASKENKASGEKMASLSDTQYLDLAKRYESGDKSVEAELRKMVDAAAEKAMRDSKIRTPDGKLRKLYHGTYSNEFNVFDKSLIGTAREGDTGFFGKGFYFTFHKGEARMYGRRVIDAYVNITNPFNFETELNTMNGERTMSYNGGRAVFVTNFAEKFPELAKKQSVGTFTKDGKWKEISFAQFAKDFRTVYETVKFNVEEIDGAYGKEWLVTAGEHEESYTNENGETFTWKEYAYQRRYMDERSAHDQAENAYEYLSKTKYEAKLPANAAVVMDTAFSEELIKRNYDGVIQSEDGDEVVAFESSQIKKADLITRDDSGNIIPLSERFKTDRTGDDAWKNEDIRYSLKDKVRLSTADGTRTFTYGDVTAKMYGNDVTLDGGKVRQRVQMLETLAERYDHVTVDASSEDEARAFENAGAKRVADEFSTGNEYGTYEFRFVESQFKRDSEFDAKQKANFAKAVLKQVGSRRNFTDQQIVKYRASLERAMTYLWNSTYGKGDQMAAFDAVDRLFDRILNSYSTMTEADADMRDTLMSQMRKLKTANGRTYYQLDVTETQMSEILHKHDNVRTYTKLLSEALGARVVVKQVDGATMLENTFKDAKDSRIKNDTVEGNMPGELLRLAQKTMEKRTNPYESESNERAAKKEAMWDAALDIIGGEKSTQQKIRDAVKEARAAERKAAKDKTAKAVDEARLAERMHEGALRAKDRRVMAERESDLKRRSVDREARLKQQFRETTARTNEARLKSDMRKVALKWNQRLVKLLANPTEASHVPVQLAREVAELTKTITEYIDSGTERGRINLEKIAKAYQQAFDDQATIRAAKKENRKYDPRGSVIDREMYDEQLVNMIDEMNEILADKSFKELSAREMMGLLNIIRGVAHTVYDANRMIGTSERKTISQVGDKMVSEFESAPKINGSFARFFLEESLDLRRIAKVFSGSNENAEFVKLSDMLNRGAIEKERVAQVLSGMFDPLTQQYGDEIRKWYGKNAEWIDTGIRQNGRKVEITKGMRVSLAMHVLNAGNMRHIENGGVTIPDKELYAKGKLKDAYANKAGRIVVQLNADQINAIISQMTEAEKAYVEVAKEFFHQRTGYYVNKTSLQLLGYRKATVENYFPIHTNDNYTQSDFASVVRDGSIEGQGFLKERVIAGNPIYLEDITSVVNRQIKGVSLYAGLAVPMRNFKAVMNAQVWHEQDGVWKRRTSVKETMTDALGDYGTKVVQGFLQDVSGMSAVDVTPGEQRVAKLQTRYVKAVLLANLKVTLKQAASYPTAAAVIPWKYLNKALLKGGRNQRLISRADVDLINQYTPLYQMRREGMANEITSIMAEKGLEQKMPWLLGWITKMDVATVGRLWSAAEYMVADQQKNLPVGSDAYYKAVAEVFNQTIQQTQPNFTPLQRNAALRSKNPVIRTLTLFGTQRMQNGGILIESAMELAHSKNMSKEAQAAAKAKFGRAVVSQLVQNVMLVAIGFVVDALRGRMTAWQDDDKDVTLESVAQVMGDQFIGNIFGSFLGGSEAWDIISTAFKRATNANAYDTEFTVPSLDAIETIIGFFNKDSVSFVQYMSGNHTAEEKIARLKSFSFKVAKAAGYLTGFPFENIAKTIVKGWIPALQDIKDYADTGELIPWLHQSGKLDKAKTAANYKAWTKAGYSGRDYFYWEKQLNGVSGGRDGRIPILLDSDLTNEQKALMMQMFDTADGYADGTVFYNKKGEAIIDFTAPSEKQQALPKPNAEPSEALNAEPTAEPTPKPTENPLSEAKQEGVQAAVKLGVPEQTAFDAFLAYQNMGKNKDESDGYSRNDEFREWLFKNVDSPEQMAVLEYQVIGQASSVKGAITYRDSGVVYRDYTNASWFKLSEHNLSKDGTNKRYEAGKQLEKTGLKVDKTVAIYDGLKELTKKAEWIDYLKNQNLTDDQIRIFLWSRGWKY